MVEDNTHKGHRARLKQEFLTRGLDGMADHKALELMLFYTIPQGDVNPLAHRLLDAFGSLSGVFNATTEQLLAVNGIGEHTACLIRLIPEIARRYQSQRSELGEILDSTELIGQYLSPEFFGQRNEIVLILCLDSKCKVLQCRRLQEGDSSSATFNIRKAMEIAFACNASQVVLAHNHISNNAMPSKADIMSTKLANDAFQRMDIYLRDHLIFAYDDFVSMRDSGIFMHF